ncbi:MAG: hypothetical protein ABIQ02_04605 [Saprospiraceae bacterium]
MTTKKYPIEETTKQKITELFNYRRLTDLLSLNDKENGNDFVGQLMDVQYQIYMLDGFLESQWDIHKADLKKYWKSINDSLQKIGYTKKQTAALLDEIKDYQKIERDCRKNKWPTKVSFRKFYTTKSCDVRLIRHLIYASHPELGLLWKENAWRYYDMITEIHDDVADLQEDLMTYNGNRFLISLLRKGAEKTRDEYDTFLKEITEKANEYFAGKMNKGKNKQLAGWTLRRSKETIKLLNAKVNSKAMDLLADSLLLAKMS